MDLSTTVWAVTIVAIVGLLLFDYVFHVRKAHEPQLKEAAIWSAIYVGLALLFGLFVLVRWGGVYAGEYYAGYITEKALSVDNLFVFLIIMASFKVPREDQQKVLLFGITFALIARTALIFVGAGLINQFAWVFYAFGLILLLTAGSLIKGELSGTQHDQADGTAARMGDTCHLSVRQSRQLRGAPGQTLHPHHRPLRRRQALHHPQRQAGHDHDAAGHGRHRRHRHPLRPGLDPRDLRPHPGNLPGVHRRGLLADGSAPAVLPHRRAAGPAHLPLLGSGHHPGLHRREAHHPRPAREQPGLHQQRRSRRRHRNQHRAVPVRHHRRAGDHRPGLALQPQGPGRARHRRPADRRRAVRVPVPGRISRGASPARSQGRPLPAADAEDFRQAPPGAPRVRDAVPRAAGPSPRQAPRVRAHRGGPGAGDRAHRRGRIPGRGTGRRPSLRRDHHPGNRRGSDGNNTV